MHRDTALVAKERNRVMQFEAPYMVWQPRGPDSTYTWPFLYNAHMELSVWDAPLQLDDHSRPGRCARSACHADQAATHAVRGCPELSGVPPGYEDQLQMLEMQPFQGMPETAPVIVRLTLVVKGV